MTKTEYLYNAKVLSVIDGDTIDVMIDLGFGIYHNARVRLAGIDTKELTDKDAANRANALDAKAYVYRLVYGKDVVLKTSKKDKYGRYLAIVFVGTTNVNESLISSSLAVPYMV